MKLARGISIILWLAASVGAAQAQTSPSPPPSPPVADRKPHEVKAPFGATREDPYYWLRDDTRKDPAMLGYLHAENAYADARLTPTKPLQDKLYQEMIGRLAQDDSSVPYLDNGYWYYDRFAAGADYAVTARRKRSMQAREEILLDQPKMATGSGYFSVSNKAVSPDNSLLAYAEDKVGRRQYVLRIKSIASGKALSDSVENVEPDLAWSGDGRTIFYIEKDPVTLLSKRVKAHRLGTPASADQLVYEEKDDSFYMSLMRTASRKYICIALQSTVSNEQRCTSAAKPGTFTLIAPRERDHLYQADHIGDHWVVRTNWQAPNYRLMRLADADFGKGRESWTDIILASAGVFIENVQPFDQFLAIEERSDGNKRLRILTNDGKSSFVEADEPAFAMTLATNEDVATPWVRYTYDSLITPETTYEANALTGERRVLKVQPAPGYDKSRYVTERVWALARDGTKVPVSLVHARAFKQDGTAPLFQYAYGSYGYSTDPWFAVQWPSLVDRGFVVAIAHIRGGQEMGRKWYDDGHLLKKKNSFTDFVDVTRYLVAQKYAAKGRVVAEGGSAGGLLMGAVANIAPSDYSTIIAQVPFVDVVTTMLDASIPLTTNEYDEWGNPADKAYYDYMLSYSPYDNVRAQSYPGLFVSTGLWDSQVQYYEPAKWVAKLRATKTDDHPLLFRVNMEAGHGGKSGRFRRYQEIAEGLSFALGQLEITR